MNIAKIILFVLIGVFFAQIIFYYPNLPEIVATHFDGTGRADGFMTKQNFVIFEVVFLLLIVGEFALLPLLIEKMPNSLINLPNKSYWLAEERRAETFGNIRSYFQWFSILLLTLFIAVNQMVFRANINRENLLSTVLWLIIGAFMVFVVVWLIKFVSQFRRIN
jgi:uncharacterized membrane protein